MKHAMAFDDSVSQAEAKALLNRDQESLRELLALRVEAIHSDVSLSLKQTFEVQKSPFEAVTLPSWVTETADAMIVTALKQCFRIACSKEQEYPTLRAQLMGALGASGAAAVLALAAFLSGTLGLAAALATVVATIVIKKIGEPALRAGYDTLCAELERTLRD